MSDLRAVFYLMTRAFLNQIFYLLKGCRGSTIETIGDLDKGILLKPPKPSACPIKPTIRGARQPDAIDSETGFK